MQALLASIASIFIDKLLKGVFNFIKEEMKEINEVRKDRKMVKELRKEKDAKARLQRITDYLNK